MLKRPTVRSGLLAALGLCLAAYLVGLAVQGEASGPVVDVWLSLATSWMPAVVCWFAFSRVRSREVFLASAALTALAVGDASYVVAEAGAGPVLVGIGDASYLLFYAFIFAALGFVALREARGRAGSVWLDCAVGSLGGAAVLAFVLDPVLADAVTGDLSFETSVAVGAALLDLLLVASVAGIAAVRGVRMRERLVLLLVGLTLYAVADVAFLLRGSATYAGDPPLDALWAIGVALIALYVDGAVRGDATVAQPALPAMGTSSLTVAAAATVAGVGVLVLSSRTTVSTLAVALAAATLVAAAARTQLAFRQLLGMADLRRQASTDDLTGLPNRRALQLLADVRLKDGRHRPTAVLMLDLDRFKEVNDSLGHQIGDELLIQIGPRLGRQLRAGDLLVRLGGDEFAILLEDGGEDRAVTVAGELRASLADPFALEGANVRTAASIGIALFPDHGQDLSALLSAADHAMYKAKDTEGGFVVFDGPDDGAGASRRRASRKPVRH